MPADEPGATVTGTIEGRMAEALADLTPPMFYLGIVQETSMHTTNLRKVGGSVMLAVPPTLLDVLNLRVGAKVDIGIEEGRLVVAPRTRPSYSLEELLAQCDDTAPDDDEDYAWPDAAPVGNELL